MKRSEDEKSQIQKAMVKVYVNDAFDRLEGYAKMAFSAMAEGDMLRTQLSALKKMTRFVPVNTVSLRRKIAEAVIKAGKYPF